LNRAGKRRNLAGGSNPLAGDEKADAMGRTHVLHAVPTEEMPEHVPERLGRYEIVRLIGRGAMGAVYEATDGESRTHIAIKAIRGMSPEGLYRFKQEFRALSRLQHRNVVSLFELALDGDRMFFTMELVRGHTFIGYVCGDPQPSIDTPAGVGGGRHRPCRDWDRLRSALRQLAAGVHAIHRGGFLHRDIKPSNVLVDRNGRVVLLDFGLVRDIHIEGGVGVTADGAVLGTPLYMSPEQATGGAIGPASDWYSVGEILYQALTGAPPYKGLGMLALLAAKRDEMPPPPSEVSGGGIPRDLEQLCMDLLARDSNARPNGEEILRRLGGSAPEPAAEPESGALFFGRETELGRLDQALAATTEARPVVVFVEGVSGIGKTALVQRFVSRAIAREAGTIALYGRCSERESIPYKALDGIMDAVSALLRSLPTAADVRAVLPRDVHSLARLFPVLLSVPAVALMPHRTRGDIAPPEARRRGIEALRELWGRLADRQRLILHIDDLQWADVDSLVLLEQLLRHPYAPALLLIGTFREQAPEVVPPLGRFVSDLREIDPPLELRHIRLGPMRAEEATTLALRLLGTRNKQSRDLAGEVAREAEGSPFFVAELVRHTQMAQAGALLETDSEVSLDDVIRHRIECLPTDARKLLEVVAVGGGKLPQGVANRVAIGEAGDQGAQSQLRSEHLIRTRGPAEADTIEIYHDRIRETTLRMISREDLPRLHLEIARELEASGDADEVALSHHFRQAGEEQIASLHTIAAADQAAKALAFDRAVELYRTALDLGAIADQDLPEIEARWGDALANAGRLYDSAEALLSAARRVDDHAPGDDRKLEWMRTAAEHLLTSGHSEKGRVVLDEVLAMVGLELPKSSRRAIGSLITTRALLSVLGLKYKVRDGVSAQDLRRLDVCWTASRGLVYTDGLVGADFHGRHLRLALKSGEPVRISRALGAEAHFMVSVSPAKVARARQLLDDAEALAEQANSHYARGMVAEHRGHVSMMMGEFRQAVEEMDRAVRTFRDHTTGTSQEVGYCQAHGAICLQFMGRIRELGTRAHQMLRESTERTYPYVEGFARGILGNLVLLAADRPAEAAEQLAIYRSTAPKHFQGHMLNYVCQSAALERYLGRPLEAWKVAQQDFVKVQKLDILRTEYARCELLLWRAASALAAAAATQDDREPLIRIAVDAGQTLLGLSASYRRGYGHLSLAGAYAVKDQPEVAAGHLRQAISAFERHEMESFVAASKHRLADLIGGTEGDLLREEADRYLEREGVVVPARIIAMIAPGFDRQ
jgi:tetratricopeptide (TPR) repeat protein